MTSKVWTYPATHAASSLRARLPAHARAIGYGSRSVIRSIAAKAVVCFGGCTARSQETAPSRRLSTAGGLAVAPGHQRQLGATPRRVTCPMIRMGSR